MTNDNRTTLVLTVVVGLLAVVAIIISAVALARNQPPTVTVQSGMQGRGGGPMQGGPQGGGTQTVVVQSAPAGPPGGGMVAARSGNNPMGPFGRIYTIAIGHDYGSHEYFDDAGYLSGFGIGMIDMVCGEAAVDCRIMWDRYTNCWDSKAGQHATGGQGLHGRWYDACTGWYQTVERSHVFMFSQPYLKAPITHFFVLNGKQLDTSKASLENAKIVFMDGWASDEKCLARETKAILPPGQIMYAQTTEQAISLLRGTEGWVALFTTDTTVRGRVSDGTFVRRGSGYSCMLDGNSMMARKDNDLPVQWNRGFNKAKNSGRFKKYCKEANDAHKKKGTVECL